LTCRRHGLHIPRFRLYAKAQPFRRASSLLADPLRWTLLGSRAIWSIAVLRIMQALQKFCYSCSFYPISLAASTSRGCPLLPCFLSSLHCSVFKVQILV